MLEQLDLQNTGSTMSKGSDDPELPSKMRGPPRLKTLLPGELRNVKILGKVKGS